MLLIFAIPAGLTYTYGRMARDTKQGWALFRRDERCCSSLASASATGRKRIRNPLRPRSALGNMEGKETRFGVAASALFATVTTDASCGAVNAMHDSFTPLGGLVPLVNIQLGEVIFGGVGAGLYGILVFVVLSVFIAGLMVGRTPEYLGKKIEATRDEARHALRAHLSAHHPGLLGLGVGHGIRHLVAQQRRAARPVRDPVRVHERRRQQRLGVRRALNANTPFWNVTLGIAMLAGRFLMIVPVMAIAGSMLGKNNDDSTDDS